MQKNLLIIGAGMYAVVAYEIATEIGDFQKIDFVDDVKTQTPNGAFVVGRIRDVARLSSQYAGIVVAIGNAQIRVSLIDQIEQVAPNRIVTLISPKAHVSPSAQLAKGCLIEPMAVVHSNCVLDEACIISAGAVVNHAAICRKGVHIDCNATVAGYVVVPEYTKVPAGHTYV